MHATTTNASAEVSHVKSTFETKRNETKRNETKRNETKREYENTECFERYARAQSFESPVPMPPRFFRYARVQWSTSSVFFLYVFLE
jgi:hypothetical protein